MSAWAEKMKQRAADLAEGRAVVEPVAPEPEKPPQAQAPAPEKKRQPPRDIGPPLAEPPGGLPVGVYVAVTIWGRTAWMTPKEYREFLLTLDKVAEHNAKCKPRDKSSTPPRRSGPTRRPPSPPSSELSWPEPAED